MVTKAWLEIRIGEIEVLNSKNLERIDDLEKLVKRQEEIIEMNEINLKGNEGKLDHLNKKNLVILAELNAFRELKGLKPKNYEDSILYGSMSNRW